MENIEDECEPRKQRFGCAQEVLRKMGLKGVADLAEEEARKATFGKSTILDRWVDLIVKAGLVVWPTAVINNDTYSG